MSNLDTQEEGEWARRALQAAGTKRVGGEREDGTARTGQCWAEIGSGGVRKLRSVVESYLDFTQEGGMIKWTLEQPHSSQRGAVQAFGKSRGRLPVIQARGEDGLNFGLAVKVKGKRPDRY